jgi:hypothetical protein
VLPPHARWLTILRTQDLFVVGGMINRLTLEAVDALENDPLWFVDPELHSAERACLQAGLELREAMLTILVVDRIDEQALKRLPPSQQDDAVVLVVREWMRGEAELQLHNLRDSFFDAYDALVRLLNQRLLLPGQAVASTGRTKVEEEVRTASRTKVEGEEVRTAGAGAHHNAFGDRSSVDSSPSAFTVEGQRSASETAVQGDRNRVAGDGAHHNAFGDDSRVNDS